MIILINKIDSKYVTSTVNVNGIHLLFRGYNSIIYWRYQSCVKIHVKCNSQGLKRYCSICYYVFEAHPSPHICLFSDNNTTNKCEYVDCPTYRKHQHKGDRSRVYNEPLRDLTNNTIIQTDI